MFDPLAVDSDFFCHQCLKACDNAESLILHRQVHDLKAGIPNGYLHLSSVTAPSPSENAEALQRVIALLSNH